MATPVMAGEKLAAAPLKKRAAKKTAARARATTGPAAPAKKTAGSRAKDAAASIGGGATTAGRKTGNVVVGQATKASARILLAEYLVCVVVLILGLITSAASGASGQGGKASHETVARAMIKFSALSGLFFLLALVTAAGPGATKTANAFGGLITAAYAFTSSDVTSFAAWMETFFIAPKGTKVSTPSGTETSGGPPK